MPIGRGFTGSIRTILCEISMMDGPANFHQYRPSLKPRRKRLLCVERRLKAVETTRLQQTSPKSAWRSFMQFEACSGCPAIWREAVHIQTGIRTPDSFDWEEGISTPRMRGRETQKSGYIKLSSSRACPTCSLGFSGHGGQRR